MRHLYSDAVTALQRRVRDKPYLQKTTRAQIAAIRTMSTQYLDKLREAQVITQAEREVIDRVKVFACRQRDFVLADIPEVNRARSDFDRSFGEVTVRDADV